MNERLELEKNKYFQKMVDEFFEKISSYLKPYKGSTYIVTEKVVINDNDDHFIVNALNILIGDKILRIIPNTHFTDEFFGTVTIEGPYLNANIYLTKDEKHPWKIFKFKDCKPIYINLNKNEFFKLVLSSITLNEHNENIDFEKEFEKILKNQKRARIYSDNRLDIFYNFIINLLQKSFDDISYIKSKKLISNKEGKIFEVSKLLIKVKDIDYIFEFDPIASKFTFCDFPFDVILCGKYFDYVFIPYLDQKENKYNWKVLKLPIGYMVSDLESETMRQIILDCAYEKF